ncbi:MAG: hypothetical protein L6Q37_10320, partial [Bdellovibrionaceae bacterium]|nr:hypothetical protein [Pseudobdellovibrionaceae bacterium]
MATLITNDRIYRTENKNDIKTVYEMLILYKDKNLLSWLQIGSPHVLLMKDNLYPISCKTLATREKSNEHVPLP